MAARNTVICTTNPLSDRELYEYLWNDGLREFSPAPSTSDWPVGIGWNHHLELLSSGSDEDNFLYLTQPSPGGRGLRFVQLPKIDFAVLLSTPYASG